MSEQECRHIASFQWELYVWGADSENVRIAEVMDYECNGFTFTYCPKCGEKL